MLFPSILSLAATFAFAGKNQSGYGVAAFQSPASISQRLLVPSFSGRFNPLKANVDDDDDEDFMDELSARKLGINIGAELPKITQEEIDEIRSKVQATLDEKVDARLAEIEELKAQLEKDALESKQRMKNASDLNAQFEKQSLMEKIDRLSEDFLNANAELRESTKRAADADKLAGSMGRGVDWGSWGSIGGLDVVMGTTESNRPSQLLGSVDSARRRGSILSEFDEDPVSVIAENRVMVIFDEKQEKASKQVVERLIDLLNDAFSSDIKVDMYSPSSNIPIGGNNAQTALIFASSLNDRSSLENILGRILKRTAPVSGGSVGMPPSHVVVVSKLGTERTNKMPYSMQNILGGKLDKLREIEQGLIAISRSRLEGKQPPLDYTVVKFGEIESSDNMDANISILPGDSLDGGIGPNAAANVLLQAMAFQPYARNSTLCSTGSIPVESSIDEASWNDKFLCLSGPELLRIDAGVGGDSDVAVLDTKFEQLALYVREWSTVYEGSRKGTGLTTPVLVRNSRKGPSKFDGVVAREGVRILFQTTNTGDRYKSATEEKQLEKERNDGGSKKTPSSSPAQGIVKGRKEGGVEVLVEKTVNGHIRVRARRCNTDHKTIVKEMSEEVIVKSFQKAVEAWVGARTVTGF